MEITALLELQRGNSRVLDKVASAQKVYVVQTEMTKFQICKKQGHEAVR